MAPVATSPGSASGGRDQPAPTFTIGALAEWGIHVENVLRGIGHALNNRASAVSAVMELSREPDDDPTVTSSILALELERLLELATVVRCVGAPRTLGVEAFAPRDVVAEVQSVLRIYADLRDRVVMIDAAEAPPTRVPRWMFTRALIALAASSPGGATSVARVTVTEDDGHLVVRADGASSGEGTTVSRYAAELARAMGGQPLDDGRGIRIPTLAEIRRREGR